MKTNRMKTNSLLLIAATMMSASSAMAQERVLEGIDSTVVYNRNEAGLMEVQSRSIYLRNEEGQVVSKTSYQYGNPHEYIVFSNEDYNGDGTLDEVQEYSYWYEDHWDKNVKKISLNFNTNMKHDLIELSWDIESNQWVPSAETVVNLSDEGKTAEVVKYWQDYNTKALIPFQKQYVKMLTPIFDKLAADPEMSIEMILHRHVEDYTLSERYEYNEETKEWLVCESRTRTYDENGDLIQEEDHYYQTYPTLEMYAGNKAIITKTANGYREDIYYYDNYSGEWSLNVYTIGTREGNTWTISRYAVMSADNAMLQMRYETDLDENERAIEQRDYNVMRMDETHYEFGLNTRSNFSYDESGHLTKTVRYGLENDVWILKEIEECEYDKAGREICNLYAQAYDGADKSWNYGNKTVSQYTADGRVVSRTYYNVNVEASTADELVWNQYEKYCNFFHHSDAETATTDEVTVTPSEGTAQFTWPIVPDANTYNLYIYLHGSLFHHYVFDSQGRLLGIHYAPGRNGAAPARYAEETANGWQFSIQDLDLGAEYTYTFTAEDANGTELQNITGSFKTPEPSGIHNTINSPTGGILYDLKGQRIGKGYKGIVIEGGKKILKR